MALCFTVFLSIKKKNGFLLRIAASFGNRGRLPEGVEGRPGAGRDEGERRHLVFDAAFRVRLRLRPRQWHRRRLRQKPTLVAHQSKFDRSESILPR